jgi:hypothetical protein
MYHTSPVIFLVTEVNIVNKSSPTEVVKSINKAALIRLRRKKEITSNTKEEHLTTLLNDLHTEDQWLICDCRPELDLAFSPGMSVVKRGGVLFLRNLPSRTNHDNDCVFKYMKSLPWLSKQEVLDPEFSTFAFKEFSLANPAELLLSLVREAEWLSFDPDFEYMSVIEKVASIAQGFSVDGEKLSDVLKQSATPLFKGDQDPKVFLFVSHEINLMKQALIRNVGDQNDECHINGGIVPAIPLSEIPNGPYLTLVTSRFIDNTRILSSAFIPVSERKCPVPILSKAERGFAVLMKNYASWLNKSEGVTIGFGKVVAGLEHLPYGFSIYSGEKVGQVKFVVDKGVVLDGDTLNISDSLFEDRLSAEQSNFIKAKLRELLS